MKNILGMIMLAAGLLVVQACGPKKTGEATEETSVAKQDVALAASEKKAKAEKQRKERAERRKIAYEKLCMDTPSYKDAKGNLIYNKAESEPSFVGGNKAMMTYLHDNVKFPQDALNNGEEGLVYVDFVVAKDGSVREAEVTNFTNEDVDQSFRTEAIRVVASMPKWVAGLQRGKAVDVKYSLPISFELQ